jgi:hypothetical protein
MWRSQEFDVGGIWAQSEITISANAVVAPDGTLTADKLVEPAAAGHPHIYEGATLTNVPHTWSIYAKAGERNWLWIRAQGTDILPYVWFDLATGTVGTTNVGITSASMEELGDGWYRCIVTRTPAAGGGYFVIGMSDQDADTNYTGDGTSGLYIWGAQLEAGAFATSYIPTTGASATRNADNLLNDALGGWYNPTISTIFMEAEHIFAAHPGGAAEGHWSFTAGSPVFSQDRYGADSMAFRGLTLNAHVGGGADDNPFKTAIRITTGDVAFAVDGSVTYTNATAAGSQAADVVFLGTRGGGQINGYIKRWAYFNHGQTDDQLEALTA